MNDIKNKETYVLIDVLKFIFSICVVGIHTGMLQGGASTTEWLVFHGIFRLAVPFFFVCSGFFIGLKLYRAPTKEQRG